MDTMTKTQSVSATKLAVATAVLLAAGGLAMATLPAMQSGKSAGPTSGANLVKVSSCEQKGADIEISRNNGPKYILKAGCKNAGSGFKDYTFECVKGGGATSTISAVYKVSWTQCATLSIAADNDTLAATGGVITVGVNKLLAVFNFSAYAKDAIISSLVLTKTGTVKNENLINIKLIDASGSVLANGQMGVAGPDKIGFSFNKVVPFGAGMPTKLMISADILGATQGGDTLSLSINSTSDIGTGSTIEVTNFPVTYGPVKVMGEAVAVVPALSVAWANDTPSGVLVPGMGQKIAKISLTAGPGKDAIVNALTLSVTSTFPITDWQLYDIGTGSPGLLLATSKVTGTGSDQKIVFNSFEKTISASKALILQVTANIPQYQTSSALSLSYSIQAATDIVTNASVNGSFPLPWKTLVVN